MMDSNAQKDPDWIKEIDEENFLNIMDEEGAFVCEIGPLDQFDESDDPEAIKAAVARMNSDADLIVGAKQLLRAAKRLLEIDMGEPSGFTKSKHGADAFRHLALAVDTCEGRLSAPAAPIIQQTAGNA